MSRCWLLRQIVDYYAYNTNLVREATIGHADQGRNVEVHALAKKGGSTLKF